MQRRWLGATLSVAPFALAGCAQMGSPARHAGLGTVTVRFVMPPDSLPGTPVWSGNDAKLASHSPGRKDLEAPEAEGMWGPGTTPYHVVLWGGPFNGTDVTHVQTSLEPGPYLFRFFDVDQEAAWQGWLTMNSGDNTLDVLRQWRQGVRESKQWLGYDAKIQGRFASSDTRDFKEFQGHLRDLSKLQRRIDHAIKAEARAQAQAHKQMMSFLNLADVLLVPGGDSAFFPTTQPAFNQADLASLRRGEAVTKLIFVADYGKTMQKIRRIGELRNELIHYADVLEEERQLFTRRKKFYRITDHIYHHDKQFVENEQHMQRLAVEEERVHTQIADCRERSLALAFLAELLAPNEDFAALDELERELSRQRTIFAAKQHRLDMMFERTVEGSTKWVEIEKERQAARASTEAIDNQMGRLADARGALHTLADATNVIYRHGTTRLMTATLLKKSVPVRVADALENEAIMTVRLQNIDVPASPSKTSVTQSNEMEAIRTAWSQR